MTHVDLSKPCYEQGLSQILGTGRGVRGYPPEFPLVCPNFQKIGTNPYEHFT